MEQHLCTLSLGTITVGDLELGKRDSVFSMYLNTFVSVFELNHSAEDDDGMMQRTGILVETIDGEATIMVKAPGCSES